jgi:hypothetical protein
MNREGARKVPENTPVGFVRRKWGNYVFGAEGIDRRFNELCVLAELKNVLAQEMFPFGAHANSRISRIT